MGWDYERFLKRAWDKYAETEGLVVRPVTKKLDFDSISLKEPWRVRDEDMLRLLHLYRAS